MPKKVGFDSNNSIAPPLLKKLNALGEDESITSQLKTLVESNEKATIFTMALKMCSVIITL